MTYNPASGTPMSERMQSLLSRAVDDQQSEQRSLASALDDVRAQLAALAHNVTASQAQPAAEQEVSAVAALTVELRESTRRTADRLDIVSRMVAQRGEDIANLQNTLAAFGEQVRAQVEGVARLAGSLDSVGQHVDGLATYLGERARDDGSRIASLEQRLMTLQNDMTAVGSHVTGLTDSAARSDLGAQLAALEQSVRALDSRLAASTGDALDARIRSIVAGALVGTERRLAVHTEEAVLALAEAMLRPRPAGGESPPAEQQPVAPQPPADAPVAGQPEAAQPVAEQSAAPVGAPAAQPLVDPLATQPPAAPAPPAAVPDNPVQPPIEELPTGTAPTPDQIVDVTDPPAAVTAASNGVAVGNATGAKGAAAWTTVMPEEDQRRRGWFRSRD